MGLETASFISGLIESNPVGATDEKHEGDNHLRLIKTVLKNTFPNAGRAFRFEEVPAAKIASYVVLADDQRKLLLGNAAGGAFTFTLPAAASVFAGWMTMIFKTDATASAVTIAAADTVNGAASIALRGQYEGAIIFFTGSVYFAFRVIPLFTFTQWDLLVGGADGRPTGLPLGATRTVLTASGGEPKWLSTQTPRGYLSGLEVSNNVAAPTTTIDIATGICRDDTDEANIIVGGAGFSKRLNALWTLGSGNGGLDSGSVAPNETYHVFIIFCLCLYSASRTKH